ncbi:MAG: glucose-1-phosphate cytidylyltransferase [Bacteroidota bacterium]
MKAVILAGGFGTRISEESGIRPKPMVEIGGKPIIWHIMKYYSSYGINDFIICCGYKSEVIKNFFSNYFLYNSDVTLDMKTNNMEVHNMNSEPWKVTLVDTGINTMTGGRLKRVKGYIGDETFCLTYGDGLSNVDINRLIMFHKNHGRLATLTAVRQPGRFGVFTLYGKETQIKYFKEKPQGDSDGSAWINGGFFVLDPKVLDYIEGDNTVFEKGPLENLASDGNLFSFRHTDFWQPMDTLRDKNLLEDLWEKGDAPWKVW